MQLRTLTEDNIADLMAWRSLALDKMPYYAAMLFSLRPIDAPGLGTFGVDPQHRLYVDFEAMQLKGAQFCAEALLHECGHLFGEHNARATDAEVRDDERDDWNCAGDFEINDDLRDAGCAELSKFGVFAAAIGSEDYQTAETYMTELRKRRQAKRQGQQSPPQSGTTPGTAKPFAGCGSGSGGQAAPGELGADDDMNGQAPGASSLERERTRVATAGAIRDHVAKGRGTVPGGLVKAAEQVLAPPKVAWRQVLSSSVRRGVAQRAGDFDTTFSRRHRRTPSVPFGAARVLRPGSYSPVPTIALVRDTSGSMSDDDLTRVTNEVEGIARGLGIRGNDLRIYDVDAAVAAVRDYKGARTLAEVSGRGGTDMRVGIIAAAAQRPAPSAIVVISDGWTPWPAVRTRIPLIICLIPQDDSTDTSNVAGACPDWALTVVAQD